MIDFIDLIIKNAKILKKNIIKLSFEINIFPSIRWNYLYLTLVKIYKNKSKILNLHLDLINKLDLEFINILKNCKKLKQYILILANFHTLTKMLENKIHCLTFFMINLIILFLI